MSKVYSLEQKEQILKEVADTGNAALVAKKHGVPDSTVYTWQHKAQKKASSHSQKSIKQLKKQLEDKELENSILKELLKKTNQAWLKD